MRAGGRETRPFRIGDDVWRDSAWKAINFFYSERCGMEIPGVHLACHQDWQCALGDRRIFINGGWHDAGDTSQGPVNDSDAINAMLGLAERLRSRGEDPDLERRVREEADLGREVAAEIDFRQRAAQLVFVDGVLERRHPRHAGRRLARAGVNPFEDYLAASAEALAARVLKDTDPALASHSLRVAREDWQAANGATERSDNAGARGGRIDTVAAGTQASVDLFQATGEAPFAAKAVELAGILLRSQQRSFLPGYKVPLAGFFIQVRRSSAFCIMSTAGMSRLRWWRLLGCVMYFPIIRTGSVGTRPWRSTRSI